MQAFFRVAWHVMRKDLTVEVRSREILFTTLFFAVSVVLVFSFALVREGRAPDDVAAGILWVAISFAGADHILAGSDYPHQIGSIPKMMEVLRKLDVSESDRAAILGGNAARLLKL